MAQKEYTEYMWDRSAYKAWEDLSRENNEDDLAFASKVIAKAMNQELSDKQRKYINAYYMKGLNTSEIAQMYGVNRSTVSRTIRRGLKRLGKVIQYTGNTFIQASLDNIKVRRKKHRN